MQTKYCKNIDFRQYDNKQKITEMEFEVPVVCYCPLGKNYYKPTLYISLKLSKNIVDFIDLEDFFKKELNGKGLTCEDLVGTVFNVMKDIYNPHYLRVQCKSDSHFVINTVKEEYFE